MNAVTEDARTARLHRQRRHKVEQLIEEEGNPDLKLRVFVQGGGCSGFQYGFTFDEIVNEDDTTMRKTGVQLLIDPMSHQYLVGAEIDYKEDLEGAQFVIKNPNCDLDLRLRLVVLGLIPLSEKAQLRFRFSFYSVARIERAQTRGPCAPVTAADCPLRFLKACRARQTPAPRPVGRRRPAHRSSRHRLCRATKRSPAARTGAVGGAAPAHVDRFAPLCMRWRWRRAIVMRGEARQRGLHVGRRQLARSAQVRVEPSG